MTIRVVTDGISQLAPKVSILDHNGNLIQTSTSTSVRGDILSLTVSSNQFPDEMFIKVEGATNDDVGGYSLITTVDGLLIVDPADMLAVARDRQFTFVEQDDIVDYLP